jgi:hypothetical protein
MLMRPKRPLDRLLALNASGPDGARPITSILFLRYRLRSLKVGADIPDQDGMIIVIAWRTGFLAADSFSN